MTVVVERQELVRMAFALSEAVKAFAARARALFYAVMLLGYACPQCAGRLNMIGESRCRCDECGYVLDPTSTFQRCPECGGRVVPWLLHAARWNRSGQDVRESSIRSP